MFLNFKFNNLFNINRDIFEVKEIINRKREIKMKRIVSKAHYTNFLRPWKLLMVLKRDLYNSLIPN